MHKYALLSGVLNDRFIQRSLPVPTPRENGVIANGERIFINTYICPFYFRKYFRSATRGSATSWRD